MNNSDFFSNDTETKVFTVVYILSILISFPPNFYVIWLIVTGTGNGLAAEFFILNFSVCEMLLCVQFLFSFFTYTFRTPWIYVAIVDGLGIIGHPLFECLICVERYLAVVYPVIFLKFKPLRYRLMCSAVGWVVTFSSGGYSAIAFLFAYNLYFILWLPPFLFFLSVQLFCGLAVLRVLKQSGPGERGREREEENHMKKRAFYIIFITTVNTLTINTPYIVLTALIRPENEIMLICVAQVFYTLAGLVQPVFFLYRVEKLNFIKCQ